MTFPATAVAARARVDAPRRAWSTVASFGVGGLVSSRHVQVCFSGSPGSRCVDKTQPAYAS